MFFLINNYMKPYPWVRESKLAIYFKNLKIYSGIENENFTKWTFSQQEILFLEKKNDHSPRGQSPKIIKMAQTRRLLKLTN